MPQNRDKIWIVLDGIDAVGKSSQLQRVCGAFNKKGIASIPMGEFSQSAIGDTIRKIIAEKNFLSVSSDAKIKSVQTDSILLVADMAHKAEVQLQQAHPSAALCISDRGTLSLCAYQAARLFLNGWNKKAALEWMQKLVNTAFLHLPKPQSHVVLTASIEVIRDRCAQRGDPRLNDTDLSFLNITQNMTINLARARRCPIIDTSTMQPKKLTEEIVKKINATLLSYAFLYKQAAIHKENQK
ncbi:MAG: dTMP kinase [Dongiaceae bacterium]